MPIASGSASAVAAGICRMRTCREAPGPFGSAALGEHLHPGRGLDHSNAAVEVVTDAFVQQHGGRQGRRLASDLLDDPGAGRDQQEPRVGAELAAAQRQRAEPPVDQAPGSAAPPG